MSIILPLLLASLWSVWLLLSNGPHGRTVRREIKLLIICINLVNFCLITKRHLYNVYNVRMQEWAPCYVKTPLLNCHVLSKNS